MAEKSINNYSFEDIQRYINGKMSPAEMHALEKAALQDNFLADAIEGFNHVDGSAASHHINQIKASFNNEAKDTSVLSFKRKSSWWRIAAIIVLIFGVGILSDYVFKKMNAPQQIAQVKMIDTNALKKFDSIEPATDSEIAITKNEPVNKNITSLNKSNSSSIKPKKKDNNVLNDNDVASTMINNDAARNNSFAPMAAKKFDSSKQLLNNESAAFKTTAFKRNQIIKDSAMPVGGWNNFNKYVAEELGKDSLLKKYNSNDFVEVEFLIDDEGNPYNLKVTKSLDNKSNEKALNIISSGPKWVTTLKQKKVELKINF